MTMIDALWLFLTLSMMGGDDLTPTPRQFLHYQTKRPDPIRCMTDEEIDEYFENWGPLNHLDRAIMIWQKRYKKMFRRKRILKP